MPKWFALSSRPEQAILSKRLHGTLGGISDFPKPFLNLGVFPQFVIAAAITVLVSMGVLSYFLSGIARDGLLRNAADEGVALIRIFIEPIAQELANSSEFSPTSIARLNTLSSNELRARVLLVKVWTPEKKVAYSTNHALIGKTLPTTRHPRVMNGEVIATFDDLHDAAVDFGYEPDLPLIEVYSPIFKTGTNEIIAVGEVYLDGDLIAAEARAIRTATIVIVSTVTLPMAAILFLFVYRSNATTLSHRAALVQKMKEAEALADQNDKLRRIAENAQLAIARSNEQLLGGLGQNLHDGPVQLLSLLVLKASALEENANDGGGIAKSDTVLKLQQLTDLISQVLGEIRTLSSGLVLPELSDLSLRQTLELAIERHKCTTGSSVAFQAGDLPDAPLPIRICLYRVVQEGLNNAFQHAGAKGQQIKASHANNVIELLVMDSGAKDASSAPTQKLGGGLGLLGLRMRVEGFQGTLEIVPRPDGGTVLKARLPLTQEDFAASAAQWD